MLWKYRSVIPARLVPGWEAWDPGIKRQVWALEAAVISLSAAHPGRKCFLMGDVISQMKAWNNSLCCESDSVPFISIMLCTQCVAPSTPVFYPLWGAQNVIIAFIPWPHAMKVWQPLVLPPLSWFPCGHMPLAVTTSAETLAFKGVANNIRTHPRRLLADDTLAPGLLSGQAKYSMVVTPSIDLSNAVFHITPWATNTLM